MTSEISENTRHAINKESVKSFVPSCYYHKASIIDDELEKHLEWAPPSSASTLPLVWGGMTMNCMLILPR